MLGKQIQKIFQCYEPYLSSIVQPKKNRKAIAAIQRCRTGALGTSYYACESAHQPLEQHHSCRHRSCSVCAGKYQRQWLESQKNRLLNTPHFHVIFTLPHEYQTLWLYNERVFSALLFKASQQTLITLLADPRYHGIEPGVMIALHTWGRKLTLHPHTHCLVTAGGRDGAGQWRDTGEYLLPVAVVKQLYRGKLQAMIKSAFENGELVLPPDMSVSAFYALHRAAYRKAWSVRIEPRYRHGKGVLLYLARYFRGGPLKPSQILLATGDAIRFRYLDHRDGRSKVLALRPKEFLRRLLWHVPAQGLHTIRYYGLYAGCSQAKRQPFEKRFGTLAGIVAPLSQQLWDAVLCCRVCSRPVHLVGRRWGPEKAFSINKAAVAPDGYAQQDDEMDFAYATLIRGP